jgi:hypothetical protein
MMDNAVYARTAEDVAALGPTPPSSPSIQAEGGAMEVTSSTADEERPAPKPEDHSAPADVEEVGGEVFSVDEQHEQLLVSPASSVCVPMAESLDDADETTVAEQPAQEPQPIKKRPVGPMLEQQRAAPFKSLADALGSLGLQKVHTETGGINCCQIYSFLISSGKMHPKQQTIGYASTNLVSACNVCLVCSLDAVRAWQGCFLQGECAPT